MVFDSLTDKLQQLFVSVGLLANCAILTSFYQCGLHECVTVYSDGHSSFPDHDPGTYSTLTWRSLFGFRTAE